MQATNIPPIHVHINNQLLQASTGRLDIADIPQRGLKRRKSSSSDSSNGGNGDSDSLLLSDILEGLHRKFPKLQFPQYASILESKGIFYAQSVFKFDHKYFVELGLSECAVGLFLSAVRRAIGRQQGGEKRARVTLKETDLESGL
jgi:hypothetical protein